MRPKTELQKKKKIVCSIWGKNVEQKWKHILTFFFFKKTPNHKTSKKTPHVLNSVAQKTTGTAPKISEICLQPFKRH